MTLFWLCVQIRLFLWVMNLAMESSVCWIIWLQAVMTAKTLCWLLPLICHCRCRHGAISKYFGDPLPSCRKSCDFCVNPEKLEKYSKRFKQLGTTSSNPRRRHVSIYWHTLARATWKFIFTSKLTNMVGNIRPGFHIPSHIKIHLH